MNFLKIFKFCSLKDTVKKIKRQATDWEEILQNTYLIKYLYLE